MKQRKILSFDAGSVGEMVTAELKTRKRRKEKAALRNLITEAIIAFYGPKYPKLCPSKKDGAA